LAALATSAALATFAIFTKKLAGPPVKNNREQNRVVAFPVASGRVRWHKRDCPVAERFFRGFPTHLLGVCRRTFSGWAQLTIPRGADIPVNTEADRNVRAPSTSMADVGKM